MEYVTEDNKNYELAKEIETISDSKIATGIILQSVGLEAQKMALQLEDSGDDEVSNARTRFNVVHYFLFVSVVCVSLQ